MSSADSQTLLSRLKLELAAWQSLVEVMHDEEQALTDGDTERLAQISTAKLTLLQSVSDFTQIRHAGLQAAGLPFDHAGMTAWLGQVGQPEHREQWQQMRALETTARALNQRIGALIELRLNSTRQALNVLLHSATSHGSLYDQEGLAVSAHKGKPLTAA